jgi:hypothetical protein
MTQEGPSRLPNRTRARSRYRSLVVAGQKRAGESRTITITSTIEERVPTRLSPGSGPYPRPGTCSWSVLPDPSARGRAADLC